ncbi:MAG: MbnP family protein [Bacteroidota bacterium]
MKLSTGLCCLLMAALLSACYEPTEGCLDVRATNFDLDADEACADCCTFPSLNLRFSNVWTYPDTTVSLRLDTFYVDAAGNPFRFDRIRFYWSNLRLVTSTGETLRIIDSLDLSIAEGGDTSMITILDDIALADIGGSTETVSLGTLEPSGTLTQLQATFGIEDPTNKAVTTSVSTSHPLAPQAGQMNLGSDLGYIFAKIEYFQDTTSIDTIPREINLYGNDFRQDLMLDMLAPTPFIEGFNPTLVIEQNITKWFEGIDVRSTDTTALKNSFVENLTQSFTLTSLLAN